MEKFYKKIGAGKRTGGRSSGTMEGGVREPAGRNVKRNLG